MPRSRNLSIAGIELICSFIRNGFEDDAPWREICLYFRESNPNMRRTSQAADSRAECTIGENSIAMTSTSWTN